MLLQLLLDNQFHVVIEIVPKLLTKSVSVQGLLPHLKQRIHQLRSQHKIILRKVLILRNQGFIISYKSSCSFCELHSVVRIAIASSYLRLYLNLNIFHLRNLRWFLRHYFVPLINKEKRLWFIENVWTSNWFLPIFHFNNISNNFLHLFFFFSLNNQTNYLSPHIIQLS